MGRRDLRRLKYLHAFIDRHGRSRYYFRRNSKRTVLPGSLGSQTFLDAYAACLAQSPGQPIQRAAAAPGTLAALAVSYYGSPRYRALAVSSRGNYRRVIDAFLKEHGHRRVDQLKREHIDTIIGKMANRPGAAIVLLKRIRTLIRYGLSIRWIKYDPTTGATSYRSREIHTWTEDQLTAYENKWPEGSRERLGYALLLYTGQRGSDVHRMSWSDIAGESIQVVQQKTGQGQMDEKLIIPLHPALQQELALAERLPTTIHVTKFKKPYSVKGFGNFISSAITAAGLPAKCKAHGLRKAAARRLAEAGATANQIAAITGHKTLAEVERYTRKADQELLAKQAMDKQSGNKSGKPQLKKVANHSRKS